MSNLIVITVSADDLAPDGARSSAGTVLTWPASIYICIYIYIYMGLALVRITKKSKGFNHAPSLWNVMKTVALYVCCTKSILWCSSHTWMIIVAADVMAPKTSGLIGHDDADWSVYIRSTLTLCEARLNMRNKYNSKFIKQWWVIS